MHFSMFEDGFYQEGTSKILNLCKNIAQIKFD
jgi:hypothetical protein